MISLYELFKIIFGLIIAGFVLVIVVQIVSVYTGVQEDSYDTILLHNALKVAGDVFVTGNSVEAPFPVVRFNPDPPALAGVSGNTPLLFPLLYSPPLATEKCVSAKGCAQADTKFLLSRQTLNLGWTSFSVVEAVPTLKVFFNMQDSRGWELVRQVVNFMPDSAFGSTHVTFGTCDGGTLSSGLEQQDFLSLPVPGVMRPCTIKPPEDGVVVTIAPSCSGVQGICASPAVESVGDLSASGQQFWYMDPLDIVAVILGGERKDITGPRGIALYHYKNDAFRDQIVLSARIIANRALLVGGKYPPGSPCYTGFGSYLTTMNTIVSAFATAPASRHDAVLLSELLTRARGEFQSLVAQGCDL